MADIPLSKNSSLSERLEALGQSIGARESEHVSNLALARGQLEALHARVKAALESFHAACAVAGTSHLRVDLSEIRPDEKHLRAVEFELRRGRHRAIVVAKSRGDLTLVGPFHAGKNEGPCKTLSFDAWADLDTALGDFLETFLEEAATP